MKIPLFSPYSSSSIWAAFNPQRSLPAAHLRVLHLQLLPWVRSGKGRRSPRRTDPIFCTLGHGGSEMEEWQSKCLVYWCDWCMFVCFVDIPSGFVNAYCWPLNPLICHSKISHLAEPNRGILRRSSSIPPPQPRAINWTLKIWASWVTVGDIGALEAWWLLPLPIWFFWELKKGGFLVIQNSLSPSVLVKTRIPKINWAYGFIEMVVFLDLLKGSFVKGLSFNDLQWDNQRILFGKIGACNLEMHPGLLPTMRIIPYCTKPLS